MARRQNIERRRKQIRHYQARRRRRSPVWRAFLFWWAPALVCGLALAGMASTAVGFLAFRPGGGDPARYALPPARLGLAQATAGEVGELLRMGNARRLVGALGDADIGISLDLPLQFSQRRLVPLSPGNGVCLNQPPAIYAPPHPLYVVIAILISPVSVLPFSSF